jgi:hypothetical protein
VILLELTPKEAEFIREVIALEIGHVAESKVEWAEKERKTGICNSFLKKVDRASEPSRDEVITAKELYLLISQAKREYLSLPSDMHVSGKRVDKQDLVHVAVANALILWLNGKNLLKRLVKFDITDQSGQYEETDE